MTPSQLGIREGFGTAILHLGNTFTGEKDIETATFAREPSRNYLTDPPRGYRTPSANQPYGINAKAEAEKAKAQTRGAVDRKSRRSTNDRRRVARAAVAGFHGVRTSPHPTPPPEAWKGRVGAWSRNKPFSSVLDALGVYPHGPLPRPRSRHAPICLQVG